MFKKRHLFVRNAIAVLAATPLLWVAPGVIAQTSSPTPQESKTYQNDHDATQDKKIPRQELAQFDQFLDQHREISEQLHRDPSLVRNQQFMQSHPELQSYLQDHPQVRQDLTADPDSFLGQEQRYDRREDDRNIDRRAADRRDEDRRAQLAQFDRFLDTHRETAEQLRRDPSLVKNQQFLQSHPALQTYLQQHPETQQRLVENPNAFMQQENRYDANEDARNRGLNRDDVRRDADTRAANDNRRDNDNRQANDNRQEARKSDADNRDGARVDNDRRDIDNRNDVARDADNRSTDRDDLRDRNDNRLDNDARQDARGANHGQVVSFDQFLDKHREIAEQLRRDPSLAKNQQFVSNHPALQAYLQDHQGVREQLYQDPNGFMQQENRYESRENGMGRSGMNREQYRFGQFLGAHSSMSEELSKNPSLLKNHEYTSSHPELETYLKAHPDAQSQIAKDPDSFLKASQQFSSTAKTGTTTSTTGTTGTTGSPGSSTTKTTTPPSTSTTTTTKPPKQ
jgi:hypothetical protein